MPLIIDKCNARNGENNTHFSHFLHSQYATILEGLIPTQYNLLIRQKRQKIPLLNNSLICT